MSMHRSALNMAILAWPLFWISPFHGQGELVQKKAPPADTVLRGAAEQIDRPPHRGTRKIPFTKVDEMELPLAVREAVYTRKSEIDPPRPALIRGEAPQGITLFTPSRGGRVISEIGEGELRISAHGEFYVWLRRIGAREPMQDVRIAVSVYRTPSQKLWERTYVKAYDDRAKDFCISDADGAVVEVDHDSGTLTFYSPDGAAIDFMDVLPEDTGSRLRALNGRFSEDGTRFVVKASDRGGSAFPHGSGILFFDSMGRLLWKFDADEPFGTSFPWVSSSARYVISSHLPSFEEVANSYLLDSSGKLIRKWDHLADQRVAFSPSEGLVAINSYRQVMLFESDSGEELMRYWSPASVLGLDVSEEMQVVAVLQGDLERATTARPKARCTGGRIVVLGLDGLPVWSTELPDVEAEGSIEAHLGLSADGKRISVILGRQFWEYQMEE